MGRQNRKPPVSVKLQKKSYKIALTAFRFLKSAADLESTSYSAIVSRAVLAVSDDDIRGFVPAAKRMSRGRGRTQGRTAIGLLLSGDVIKQVAGFAESLGVWPGDVLDACITFHCRGRAGTLRNDARLLEILSSDLIPVRKIPEGATEVSIQGAVTHLPFTNQDIVCLDGTLLYLAMAKCPDAYYQTQISPGASRILSLVLSGKLRGVTTTLDLLELATMLESSSPLEEWLAARSGGFSKKEALESAISMRLALLSVSSLEVISVEPQDIVDCTILPGEAPMSAKVKIAAYSRTLPAPLIAIGCDTGYGGFSPTTVMFYQLGGFDIEPADLISGNRMRPFPQQPEIPRKKPDRHSKERVKNTHRDMLRQAGAELSRVEQRLQKMEESDDPRFIAEAKHQRKVLEDILTQERTILQMMGRETERLTGYLPKNR